MENTFSWQVLQFVYIYQVATSIIEAKNDNISNIIPNIFCKVNNQPNILSKQYISPDIFAAVKTNWLAWQIIQKEPLIFQLYYD